MVGSRRWAALACPLALLLNCAAGRCETSASRADQPPPAPATAAAEEDLPQQVQRELARADERIRVGLARLADKYPQLQPVKGWPPRRPESVREISIGFYHGVESWPKTSKPVGDAVGITVLVIRPTSRLPSQPAYHVLYPNLGLIGTVAVQAGQAELDQALKQLVDASLAPLKELDEKAAASRPAGGSGGWSATVSGLQCRLVPAAQTVEVPEGQKPGDLNVGLAYEVRNASDRAVKFCTYGAPFENHYGNLTVLGPDGKRVQCFLPMVKRLPPGPRDFLTIQGGEKISRPVKVGYDLTAPGTYRISSVFACSAAAMHAYYGAKDEEAKANADNVWMGTLESNTVTVDVVRPAAQTARP